LNQEAPVIGAFVPKVAKAICARKQWKKGILGSKEATGRGTSEASFAFFGGKAMKLFGYKSEKGKNCF